MKKIWYFPLENVKGRYTEQLCTQWIPNAFRDQAPGNPFIPIIPENKTQDIKTGAVLDAVGRGRFSLQQVDLFLQAIDRGELKDGDSLYFQDFWTPGIEAIYYALSMKGIHCNNYSMFHAQSVDEYDFTYPMRNWMRPIELGYANRMDGIFVASTCHKDMLRAAGFFGPIHVIGLPIDTAAVTRVYPVHPEKENMVVFSSRLDEEKNPFFMMALAERILSEKENWRFAITTSFDKFRSNNSEVIKELEKLAAKNKRLLLYAGQTKAQYYGHLAGARIQLNTSLQDFVSWTMLEAAIFGCDFVYPNFRSFPELLPTSRMYHAFNIDSAMDCFDEVRKRPMFHTDIVNRCNLGRLLSALIISRGLNLPDINVWHEKERAEYILRSVP